METTFLKLVLGANVIIKFDLVLPKASLILCNSFNKFSGWVFGMEEPRVLTSRGLAARVNQP